MNSRGVALVVTLLLLFLMSVLGLAAVLSTSSDLMINGYYSNYRASFYAADAGLNIARQTVETQLLANFPNSNFPPTCTAAACMLTTANNALAYITNNFGGANACSVINPASLSTKKTCYLNAGGASGSLQEGFNITTATLAPAPGTQPEPIMSGGTTIGYTYTYNYTLTSTGSASGSEKATVSENGSLIIKVQSTAATTTNTSFSSFGAFINSFPACNGPLVYGTLSGPMYANGQWNFGSGGSYTFTDPVDETGAKFSYWTGGGCTQSANVPYKSGSTTISPNFEGGYNMNVPAVPLPANDFSQRWAVLDGKGCGEGGTTCDNVTSLPPAPTLTQMNAALQNAAQNNAAGAPYGGTDLAHLAAPAAGVFLPYTCTGASCTLNPNAGGLYVEGSGAGVTSSITLSTTNGAGGASNPSGQVIQVTQVMPSTSNPPVITQTQAPSCTTTTSHHTTTWTCTSKYQQTTQTNTPTTTTTVTIDPAAGTSGTTTVVSSNAITTGTLTSPNTSYTCTSTSGACSPTAPTSISGGSTTNSTVTTTENLNLTGVPENLNTSPATPATMVYVDGNVNISGPSSGAAVQNNAMITVTANGNIQQTGNLIYATRPVTTTQNQVIPGSNPACCNGDPVDTLIPSAQNMNQVLGLFTANGEFQLNPSAGNNSNLETDASIAAISSDSHCTPANQCGMIATPGNSVNTWTNVGGRVENSINGVSINTGNVFFDRRFTARNNFAPPWFPQTSIAQGDIVATTGATVTPTIQRVQWVSNSGGQ